jgi:3-methyladenine DNA glycosylase AlkD
MLALQAAMDPHKPNGDQKGATMQLNEVLDHLQSIANADNVAGMARFGINSQNTLGIDIYTLRKIAKGIGTDHALALQLWNSGIHEARILASYIADPHQMSEAQIEQWVADFDSWDVCDQVVELFSKTPFTYRKVADWAQRPEEFVKRAAFALIAELAAHDKQANDEKLAQFFPIIVRASDDDRNFVKKAVNWALRNLGKRNRTLNKQAIATARHIQALGTRPARWIAADALRELTSAKVQGRFQ